MKDDKTEHWSSISRRKVLGLMAGSLAAMKLGCAGGGGSAPGKKLVILGFDGMDFRLVTEMIGRGELPNFKRVADAGSFRPLISSIPPQSPVAWSNFITGKNPGGHGIFDFIARDPKTYLPEFSMSKVTESGKRLDLFGLSIPLSAGKAELLRKGKSWWELLEEHGVPSTVLHVPSNFPPADCSQKTISGMGTPDILGTYGTFSFYTAEPQEDGKVQGGKIYHVEVADNTVEAEILGPKNSLVKDSPDIKVQFKVYLDPVSPQAKLVYGGREVILKEGEWSDWQRVSFPMTSFLDIKGIMRVYLKQVRPEFKLYISPINIDPSEPTVPISTPSGYSKEVTDKIGFQYTQGIPEDTWALNEGRLNEDEYLVQARIAENERIALFKLEMERFRKSGKGAYFCYFGTTDTCSHMFWGHRDPKSPIYDPAYSPKYSKVVEGFYEDMDKLVGYTLDGLPKDTSVIIVSDHGFSPFYRAVHLNRWLLDNGYLALADAEKGESGEFFENVDWSRTKAYAIGLNGLYVNLDGREGQGTVSPSDKAALVSELVERLAGIKDPANGVRVIERAYDTSKAYNGPYKDKAPDIVVGYNYGYRSSWETALGKIPKELVVDNKKKWSGDHCMDRMVVPGIFFCSEKVKAESVNLEDIAPSILTMFGVGVPGDMDGKTLV